jgi:hypothetical protein
MKKLSIIILSIGLIISSLAVKAQNPLSQNTQVEIGIGYLIPNFQKGNELLRAFNLRKSGLSYYADVNGNRKEVGKYSTSSGYNITIGFYKPIKLVKGLMLGALVRNAQTGSTPEKGGYEEAYFFNFITAGLAAKYYPFEKNNLFIKAAKEQNFFHQFGIGSALGLEAGYALRPFKNKSTSVELKLGYQLANTRVEVNGIGDDNWRFGALFIGTSLNF